MNAGTVLKTSVSIVNAVPGGIELFGVCCVRIYSAYPIIPDVPVGPIGPVNPV